MRGMLNGKIALISGASRGIGAAIARRFAGEGASVALLYAASAEKAEAVRDECRALGAKAEAYRCDVADFAACGALIKQVKADFGGLDVLVNNAGITRDKLVLGMKEQDFDEVVDTNLKGAFNLIRHACPLLLRSRAGRIVSVSSVAGLSGNAGQANYAASKAGLIGLTKSVARELAGRGVTCNAVAPGLIRTDMTAGFTDDHPMLASIPLGRVGAPEEVAALVAFLASDEAAYITGEVIRIDGGLAM